MDTKTHPSGGLRCPSQPHESGRLFVFARHAESSANVASVISSDPGWSPPAAPAPALLQQKSHL
jgi:hypothetical protein